ncbi:MAG: phosphatase PAP2 family protein [Clostridia bacterium]|nr:phosphatase PAP2 family protein [Clostridia bacterium]
MKKENRKNFCVAISMLVAFVMWTMAVQFVDVRAIGPQESTVGFATINHFVHNLTGVHMSLYTITDWLGIVPLGFVMGFALLGLVQWIRRKNLLKVDYSILVLGGFYIVVMAAYILFEVFVVNYRPILIGGILEASYPSSTTMLVMCVMPTAIMQFNVRIKHNALKHCVASAIVAFIVFMVIGRLVSGVHWFTDIVGGALLSVGLVLLYHLSSCLEAKQH